MSRVTERVSDKKDFERRGGTNTKRMWNKIKCSDTFRIIWHCIWAIIGWEIGKWLFF